MIKLIAFDLDGTLIDSKKLHFDCLNAALRHLAGIFISEEEQITIYDGLTTVEKLNILSKQKGLSLHLFPLIKNLKQQLTFNSLKEFQPTSQVQGLFWALKLQNYKIAICSNSIKNTVNLIIDKLQLSPFLDLILSNEDIQYPKPNPEIYNKSAEYFKFKPDECVAVEDGKYGILSAKTAGFHVVEVNGPNDVHEKLTKFLNEKT